MLFAKWRAFCFGLNVLINTKPLSNPLLTYHSLIGPWGLKWNFRLVILKLNLVIDGLSISCGITPAECHWNLLVTSHYLSQCWPSPMLLYVITSPQWVNGTPVNKIQKEFAQKLTYFYSSNEFLNFAIITWYIKLAPLIKMHIYIVNSLWPSDAIWWHRSGSTWAQIISLGPHGLMRPVSGLNTPVWWSQLPAGESPADTLAPAIISMGCLPCLHWLLTWVACGTHPCRSCMVAPRDFFQDDKEASGILKIIKS